MKELDTYLSSKHDQLLAKFLPPSTYKKKSSLAIVDGFSVETNKEQVLFFVLQHFLVMSSATSNGMRFVLVVIKTSGSHS